MHASEVAAHQSMIDLAYKLVATEGDAQIDAIRKDVIVVLWPTLNPDGMDMVVDWYRKYVKTPFEGHLPYLYQEYVGHDNNRDGYMLNMIESQSIYKAEQGIQPGDLVLAPSECADAGAHLGAAVRGPDVIEHQFLRAHVDHLHRHEHDGGVRGTADARRDRRGAIRQLVSRFPGLHARVSQHDRVLHGKRTLLGPEELRPQGIP